MSPALACAILLAAAPAAMTPADPTLAQAAAQATSALVAKHGAPQRARIERGVAQVVASWRPSDGDGKALAAFLEAQFVSDPRQLDALLARFEQALEALDGGFVEQNRTLSSWAVLDQGPMQPVDQLLQAFDAGAHQVDDLFDAKLAFVALENFPLTTLEERLRDGDRWSRRQWAEARLAGRFARRVPASVNQQLAKASAEAEIYIADYNVCMHHVVDGNGAAALSRRGCGSSATGTCATRSRPTTRRRTASPASAPSRR